MDIGTRNHNNKLFTKLSRVRIAMIDRCTNPDSHNYENYGARGVAVCPTWLESFDNFLEDVVLLPGWDVERFLASEIQLDKDSKGLKEYSKEGCVWLSPEENRSLGNGDKFYAYSPEGQMIYFTSITNFSREYDLPYYKVQKRITGKTDSKIPVDGWIIPKQKVKRDEGKKRLSYTPPFTIKSIDSKKEVTFESIADVAKYLSCDPNRVREVLNPNKKAKSVKGYLVKQYGTAYSKVEVKTYYAVSKEGNRKPYSNMVNMCKELGLNITCVSECINGKQLTHKGYTFEVEITEVN